MLPRLASLACVLLCACAAPRQSPKAAVRVELERPVMGTLFRVVVYGEDAARAREAAAAALERVLALEAVLSDYDPASELSRLSARADAPARAQPVQLSRELFEVLERAQELARASRGAFDVTVGPYVHLWRRARRQGELPAESALAAAAQAVGFEKLELDAHGRRARLLAPGMRLDLGGIGKGYALERAYAVLVARGFSRALVVGGGELRAGEPPPGAAGWRVALVDLEGVPSAGLELANVALATSGDLAQHLELDGVRYSHVLDPRTGRARTERRLVSVLARDAGEADALATALSVLEPAEGLALARRRGAEARLLARRSGHDEDLRTPGFPRLSSVPPAPFASAEP